MKKISLKLMVLITYVVMIFVNWLANALPINNITPSEVSDMFSNPFVPTGFTFSIWGLIYLFLGIYVIYQLIKDHSLFEDISKLFIVTSIANALWIFSWHYLYIGISLILMIIILLLLIKISLIISKSNFTRKDFFLIKVPFSVYFGWITVATIANVFAFLISLGWEGFGISLWIWTVILIIIGTIIGILVSLKNKDIPYCLTLIWAFFGILFRHIYELNLKYEPIIVITLTSIVLFISTIIYLIYEDIR